MDRQPPDAPAKPRRRYAPRMPPEKRREQLLDAALHVIVEQGYENISIESVARAAGVTRPVIYDHFPNLAQLLQALIEREESIALGQLAAVVPESPQEVDPAAAFGGGVRRFLDAVTSRPDTWRIILLPPEGTPTLVRRHVETNRAQMLGRIEQFVRWGVEQGGLPAELDVEVSARAILRLSEEAGRMVLTEPERFTPERYGRFAHTIVGLIWSDRGSA